MASLGFPVISAEPVQQHVDTIQGSIDINPSFRIDLQHIGISITDRSIRASFGHGARNWGASEFHEVGKDQTFETELQLKTLDHVLGNRKVSLLKIDCEGCEWETLKSARKTLRKVYMIKIEVVQPSYTAGNETVSAQELLLFLEQSGFELYMDVWAENHLYFGKYGNEILDIDKMFGSQKFNLNTNIKFLNECAKKILSNPINASLFNHKQFLKSATDVIAVEKILSTKMKSKWF